MVEVKEKRAQTPIVQFSRSKQLEEILAKNLQVSHGIDILPSDLGNIHWKLADVYNQESNNDNAHEEY